MLSKLFEITWICLLFFVCGFAEIANAQGNLPDCLDTPLAPRNGGVITYYLTGKLVWPAAPNASGYRLYFGTVVGNDFYPTIADNIDLGNVRTYTYDLQPNADTYGWQVVPYNQFGEATNCPLWTFTIDRRTQLEQNFKSIYGEDWVFSWNNEFNTIYMMIGSYEPAFGITSEDEAHTFINTFMADVDSFIRVEPSQLVPSDSTYLYTDGGGFAVVYAQKRNSIEVLYRSLSIHVIDDRQEIKVSNNLFPDDLDMGISFVPSLSVEEAIERVQTELHEGQPLPTEWGPYYEPHLLIYPPDRYHRPYGGMEINHFHLCYVVVDDIFKSYVDATTGSIIRYGRRAF